MGTLSSFKVMKVDESEDDVIVLRTSRVCGVLGMLFILAGLGILFQLYIGRQFVSLFAFCLFGFMVAVAFIIAGLVLVTYRKNVRLCKQSKKISLLESSILGVRTTAYDFDEITNVELTRDCECILANHARMWLVKLYVCHGDSITVERVFATVSPYDAKQAAESIAFAANKELIISCLKNEKMIFSRT